MLLKDIEEVNSLSINKILLFGVITLITNCRSQKSRKVNEPTKNPDRSRGLIIRSKFLTIRLGHMTLLELDYSPGCYKIVRLNGDEINSFRVV